MFELIDKERYKEIYKLISEQIFKEIISEQRDKEIA
jgi:hypothetical protein